MLISLDRWLFLLNVVQSLLWFLVVILPTIIRFDYGRITKKFSALNLLNGQGAVGESYVFFGVCSFSLAIVHD